MLRRPVGVVNVSLGRLCGPAGFLSEIIADPVHSLIDQSRNAEECKTNLNADGFGVAWYGHRPEPGLYCDVYPTWSDPNLQALSEQVKSAFFWRMSAPRLNLRSVAIIGTSLPSIGGVSCTMDRSAGLRRLAKRLIC